jgi:hypothetical protein
VPLALSAPLPDSVTISRGWVIPLTEISPLPLSFTAASAGRWTSTLIGLLVVNVPVVLMTFPAGNRSVAHAESGPEPGCRRHAGLASVTPAAAASTASPVIFNPVSPATFGRVR